MLILHLLHIIIVKNANTALFDFIYFQYKGDIKWNKNLKLLNSKMEILNSM